MNIGQIYARQTEDNVFQTVRRIGAVKELTREEIFEKLDDSGREWLDAEAEEDDQFAVVSLQSLEGLPEETVYGILDAPLELRVLRDAVDLKVSGRGLVAHLEDLIEAVEQAHWENGERNR